MASTAGSGEAGGAKQRTVAPWGGGAGCLGFAPGLLSGMTDHINTACCGTEGCTRGLPNMCTLACRAVFLPFWDSCGAALGVDADRLFASFAEVCRDGAVEEKLHHRESSDHTEGEGVDGEGGDDEAGLQIAIATLPRGQIDSFTCQYVSENSLCASSFGQYCSCSCEGDCGEQNGDEDDSDDADAEDICSTHALLALLLACTYDGTAVCSRSCDAASLATAVEVCATDGEAQTSTTMAQALAQMRPCMATGNGGITATGCTADDIAAALAPFGGLVWLMATAAVDSQQPLNAVPTGAWTELTHTYEACARRPPMDSDAADALDRISTLVELEQGMRDASTGCTALATTLYDHINEVCECPPPGGCTWATMSDETRSSCAAAFLPVWDRCGSVLSPLSGEDEAQSFASECMSWQLQEGRVEIHEQVTTDPRWFCREGAGVASFYDKCDACVGPPLCCDYALARTSASSRHRLPDGTDGRRCTTSGDGSVRDDVYCEAVGPRPTACVGAVDGGDVRTPPAQADLRWFCKESATSQSFYDRCNQSCTEPPQCCDYSLARVSTRYEGAKRCIATDDSALAAAAGRNCAGIAVPGICPGAAAPPPQGGDADARWFCKESTTAASFYDKCEACVAPPLCCDYALARASASSRHRLPDGADGRRCTVGDASAAAGVGLCAGLATPATCPMALGGGGH